MKTNTIGFIGGGRITRIFLQAFKNKSMTFDSLLVLDPNEDVMAGLNHDFPEIIKADNTNCAKQDLVIMAVHPPAMMEALTGIKDSIHKESVVLSLAPKFNIGKMTEVLSTDRVIRMIPNATSFINLGYNPVNFNDSFSQEERSEFIKLFSALGETFEVDEHKLEGYALVSAMLPTYFWFQWKEMEKIAEEIGLTKNESIDTIYESLKASLELMYNSNLKYEEVIDLIPVKPIGENEAEIKEILNTKLLELFNKIKPLSK
jgi:pyrroline-5-carboxylate reductase